MARPLLEKRTQAVKLRRQGKSYSQIKEKLQVSKSTLSYWLRKYPLSKEQLDKLVYRNEERIEKYRETMRLKKEKRLMKVYHEAKKRLLPLSERELLLFGLSLYWGEGLKASSSQISFSNSDPKMARFYLYWLTDIIGISKEKIKVRLHLYKDMDIEKEVKYWARNLKLPRLQFNKPYIKKTTLKSVAYKGFGHGTCEITYGSVKLKEKIMMEIKSIADYYSDRL